MDVQEYNNPFTLQGKRILITGASSGIGRSVALNVAKQGGVVYICGRNELRLKETFDLLLGSHHQMFVGDLTQESYLSKLSESLPALDGIVHCAGIGHRKICKQIQASDVDEVMNINFKFPVLLQSALLAKKKVRKDASIVFIASKAASSPSIGNAVYSASKGAIISYAKCLALELASRGIRVNCISPAMVWTDLILAGGISKEELEEAQLKYPLKRYGRPEDVAYLVIYLLSDVSSWMTGSDLDLTGGGER